MAGYWLENSKRIIALLSIIILILVAIFLRIISVNDLSNAPTLCIYKNLTGNDCWGCGTSRAVISIMHLEFKQAYHYNKGIVLVFPLLSFFWLKLIIKNIQTLRKK